MNKPCGYVCSAVSDSHKTVYSLLPEEFQKLLFAKRGHRLHTVGRLDCETSGLLLLTTDGDFSHKLTAPDMKVEKKYLVTLKNPVPENHNENLDNSWIQEDYREYFSKPHLLPAEKKAPEQMADGAKVEFINKNQCYVTIKQGKFHQVRRMFLSVENEVIALHRLSVGEYILPDSLSFGDFIVSETSNF